MKPRSMTGFARLARPLAGGEAGVTLKSVNHRSLDLRFQTSSEFEPFEHAVRALVRQHVRRGHVDVRLSYTPAPDTLAPALNRPLFEAYLRALEEAAQDYGVISQPDMSSALRIPGMLSAGRTIDLPETAEAELLGLVEEALGLLNEFREREGASLVEGMLETAAAVGDCARKIAGLRQQVQPMLTARLEERMRELLNGIALDPQRIVQEAALMADRSDIAEEIQRLTVHSRELEELLRRGGEMGKQLDFLLQEMNREANTILSKTSGAGELGLQITALGVEAKTHIERMREQSLNLE